MNTQLRKKYRQKLCKACHRKYSHYRFAKHTCTPYQPKGGGIA